MPLGTVDERLAEWIRYANYLERMQRELEVQRFILANVLGVVTIIALVLTLVALRTRRHAERPRITVPPVTVVFDPEPAQQLARELLVALTRARFWKRAYFNLLPSYNAIGDAFARLARGGGIYLGPPADESSSGTIRLAVSSTVPRTTSLSERSSETERRQFRQVIMQNHGYNILMGHLLRTGGLEEDLSMGIVREGNFVYIFGRPMLPRENPRETIMMSARTGADFASRFRVETKHGRVTAVFALLPHEVETEDTETEGSPH